MPSRVLSSPLPSVLLVAQYEINSEKRLSRIYIGKHRSKAQLLQNVQQILRLSHDAVDGDRVFGAKSHPALESVPQVGGLLGEVIARLVVLEGFFVGKRAAHALAEEAVFGLQLFAAGGAGLVQFEEVRDRDLLARENGRYRVQCRRE